MPNDSGIKKTVVKIGEQEVDLSTLPEFTALLNEVRAEEKGKLYSKIATLEAQITVLTDEKKTSGSLVTAKEKELAQLREELVTAKAQVQEEIKTDKDGSNGKSMKDTQKTGDALDENTLAKLLAESLTKELTPLRAANEALTQKIQSLETTQRTQTTNEYRAQKLAELKGQIIPELVPQNLGTIEEVNAAVAKALETSKGYLTREIQEEGGKVKVVTLADFEKLALEQKSPEEGKTQKAPPPQAPEKPDNPGGGAGAPSSLVAKVETMTDEEYEKNRAQILAEAKQMGYEPV